MKFDISKKVSKNKATSLIALSFLLVNFTFHPLVNAAPQGGHITGGVGNISQSGLTTTINQNTSSLAIDWNSFNVNSNEIVNFLQPGTSSIALNRILGGSASEIFGQINANGHVVLVNPNGVFFGDFSSINVGGLIASGLDISPTDFMNGNYIFNEVLGTDGTVINSGLINASLGGNVTLLGKEVINEGVISAQLGSINLAAGKSAVLTFDQQGVLGVQVTEAILQDELGIDPAVLNSGEIDAEGGRVLLTANVSQDVFSQAVNSGDIEQATSVVIHEDGSFTLGAGADVINSGTIDVSTTKLNQNAGQIVLLGENITSSGVIKADADFASGGDVELHAINTTLLTDNSVTSAWSANNGVGGAVKVLGDKVGLFDNSVVDVSGSQGGGHALIGGDYQGKNNQIKNSQRTVVSKNAQIFSDALSTGNGGKVIIWSDGITVFNGYISSTGGKITGDGGFIEISGKNKLGFYGETDKSAVNGEAGTLLLDPDDINIVAGASAANDSELDDDQEILFNDGGTSSNVDFDISATKIISELNNGNVTIAANGRIDIETDIDASSSTSGNSLTFVTVTDEIRLQNGADITTNNANITFEGGVKLDDNGSTNIINTGSGIGNITFTSNIISTNENNALELNAGTGIIDIQGNVASNTDNNNRLNAFTITNSTNVNLLDVSVETGGITVSADTINLGGNLRTDGDIDAGIITLFGDITLTSNSVRIETDCNGCGSDADIIITGDIDDDIDVLTRELTLDSGSSNTAINGVVGGVRELLSFTIEQSGSSSVDEINTLDGGVSISSDTGIDLSDNIITNTGTNGGVVDLNGAVTLSANVSINTDATGTDGIVDFSSTVDTDAAAAATTLYSLAIDAGTSTVAINGTVGGIDRLLGLSIPNASEIILSAINVGSSGLTANGGTLNLDGDIDTNAGIVDLDSVNNLQLSGGIATAGGDVFIDVTDTASGYFRNDDNDNSSISSGTGNVTITTAGNDGSRGVRLGAITTTGTGALSVTTTNGSIIQSTDADRDLDIGGASSFNAGTNSIILNNDSNDFIGAVSFTTSSNVLVNDSTSITFGTSNITGSGNFEVTAINGGISQLTGSALTVNGETTFTSTNGDIIVNNSGNNFIGVVNVDNTGGNAVTLRDDNIYTLGSSSLTGGTYTVNADTDINLPTSLSVNDSASSLVLNAGNDINIMANPLTGSGSLALTFNSDADASTAGQINLNTTLIESGGSSITFNGDTILQVSSTVDSGISKVDFMGTLDATTARSEGLKIIAGDVDFDGTVGATRLGDLTIDSTGDIVVLSAISASSLNVIKSNSFDGSGVSVDTTGDADSAGGNITIQSVTTINVGNIDASAGDSTVDASDGANGGDIIITGENITVAEILTLGGDAFGGTQTGGTGGKIELKAVTDTLSKVININGNLDRRNGFDTVLGVKSTVRTNTLLASALLDGSGSLNGEISIGYLGAFSSNLLVTGSNDPDTLFAANNALNDWLIDADSGGSLNALNIQFSSIENLSGGSQNDSFVFSGAGDVINIDGNGGTNTITGRNDINRWILTAANAGNLAIDGGATYINSFIDIQSIVGGSTADALTGHNNDNTWNITSPGSGNIQDANTSTSVINFSSFNALNGGTGADTFNIVSNNLTTALLTINGGTSATTTEYDTLTGPNVNTIWTVTAQNSGTLVDDPLTNLNILFSDIENLKAGSGDDKFAFLNNFDVDGFVDGGLHTIGDTIDLSSLAVVAFNVSGGLNGRINFESVNGNWDSSLNSGNSTIIGENTINDWQITGDNSGSVGGLIFTNFNNLTGGTDTDTFTFTDLGEISGLIDGNGNSSSLGGIELIDLIARLTDVTVQESSTGNLNNNNILEFTNIEQIDANTNATLNNEILAGSAISNTWIIDADRSGTLNADLRFNGFSILTGADNVVDNFSIVSTSLPSQLIFNGGASIDPTEYDTLNGPTVASTWTLNGINSGSLVDNDLVASVNVLFNGIENLTASDATNDIFNLAVGGFLSGNLTGGTGTGIDEIVNAADTTSTWNITGGDQGDLAGIVFAFTGIESLTGSNIAADIFNIQANGALNGVLTGGTSTGDSIVNLTGVATDWNITDLNEGNVTAVINAFTGIENITGTDNANDVFYLAQNGGISGIVDGGTSGNDEIISQRTTDTIWNVTGADTGNVNGADTGNVNGITLFADIENLTGNIQNDTFNYTVDASSISGIVKGNLLTGQTDADTVDMSDMTTALDVVLGTDFIDIEKFIGNSHEDSTFTAQNLNNNWDIFDLGISTPTNTNQGTVTDSNLVEVTFVSFNNITGGDQADNFLIEPNGDILGTINGGAGNDTIDLSLQTGVIDKTVGSVLSGLGSVISIEGIKGNGDQSILRVSDAGSTWLIDGLNSGTVTSGSDTTVFTDFNILQGGDGDDIFAITETGAIGDQAATDLVSRINGGAGNDSLTITLAGGDAKINLFAADGIVSKDGNLTFSSASGSNDSIQINGALANFDTALYSVDYISAQAIHSYNSATSVASVTYTGVEAVNDFVQAADLIISGAGGNNIVDINGNGAGAGTFDVATTNPVLPAINWATVNYQNKTSLSVRDLDLNGIINIMSNLEVDTTTGYFDFEAAQIVNAGGYTLTGNELRLDSVLVNIDSAKPLDTDINKLQVTNSSANIYVLEADGINLEQADTTGFLSIVSSNGDIADSDTQGLVSSGDLSLNAMAGSILLDNAANNLTGTVSLVTGTDGSATLNNSASNSTTTLGASNVGAGTLTVISTNAEIVSTDTLVASAAILNAGNNAINLANVNNDFDSLTVLNAASLDVTDVDDLELANVTFGSGILNIKAIGITQQLGTSITQTADIFLGTAGTVTIDSATGGINLSNAANDFIGDVSLINSGSSDVLISDTNNIQFSNTTIGSGLFTVSASSGITQTAAITQQTGAAGATFNAGAGVISLADTGNDFTATVSLFNTGNNAVDLTDSNSVELGLSDVGGSFDIVALNGGDITQNAALSVAADASFTVDQGHIIKLDNANNNFQQGVSFFAGGGGQLLDVLISNNRALNLGDINVSRHLAVVANGDVTNSGILTVGGVTWIEATGNTVSLNNTSSNFNDIVINSATASITDVDDINIGTADSLPYAFSADSAITNNLTLTSLFGNITDTAGTVLSVGDTVTFSAGDIILDEVANNFNKVNIIGAQNVSLVDVDTIDIQSTVINGDLNVIAVNGITSQNGSLTVLGASHFTAGSNENITINHAGNQLNGSLTFDALSGNLSNVSVVNTVATDIQGLTLNNTLSVVSGGAITQSGGFNVDTAILSAINSSLVTQDILLDDINNINNLSIGNAHNVTLNNATNALTINELNATGVVDIISGNLLSVNAISGTDITLNSASGFANLQGGISASGTMNITANGIILDGIVESGGDALLDAQTGDVSLNNTITVSAGDLTITGNNILQSGGITAQAGNINLTSAGNYSMNIDISAGQNITLVSQTGDIAQNGLINSAQGDIAISSVSGAITMGATTAATATNGSIQYSAEGNVNVALLSALNGTAAVSSNSGQIIDSNGTAANFKSITLQLDAVTGIGNNKALETEVAIMDIHNTISGDIKLQQTGSVEFVALHNIQSNGLVDVRSNGDFVFNPGSVAVSRDQGTLFMSTSSGSFLGNGLFDLQNADITANVATFFALSGTFGTTVRPLVLDVPTSGSVLIDSRTSSIRFHPQTPDDLVTTGIDIGALGVVSAVAGEQLVEIESLGDIDPAIFTDLQNYSKAETSIRMPRDQLFEDELEEENQQI